MILKNAAIVFISLLSLMSQNSARQKPPVKEMTAVEEKSGKLEDKLASLKPLEDAWFIVYAGEQRAGYSHLAVYEMPAAGGRKQIAFVYNQEAPSHVFKYKSFKYVTLTDDELHFLESEFRGYGEAKQAEIKVVYDQDANKIVITSDEGQEEEPWGKDIEVFQDAMLGYFLKTRKAKANSTYEIRRFLENPYAVQQSKITVNKMTGGIAELTLATIDNGVLQELSFTYLIKPPSQYLLQKVKSADYALELADPGEAKKVLAKGFDRKYRSDPFIPKGTKIGGKRGPDDKTKIDPKTGADLTKEFSEAQKCLEIIKTAEGDKDLIEPNYQRLQEIKKEIIRKSIFQNDQKKIDDMIAEAETYLNQFEQLKNKIMASCNTIANSLAEGKIAEAEQEYSGLQTNITKLPKYEKEYPVEVQELARLNMKAKKSIDKTKSLLKFQTEKISVNGIFFDQKPFDVPFTMNINLFGINSAVSSTYRLYKSNSRAFITADNLLETYKEGDKIKGKPYIIVKRIHGNSVTFLYENVEVDCEKESPLNKK